MFEKKKVIILIGLTILLSSISCGYSVWYYMSLERVVEENDTWSFEFAFVDYQFDKPASVGSQYGPDTAFYYIAEFTEKDTTKYARLQFRVEDVRLSYSQQKEPLVLMKYKEFSVRDMHDGATSVNHAIWFGPFSIPKQRPDTIVIEQNVTIFYRDSGDELKSFPRTVKGVLSEARGSYFRDFVRGT